MKTESPFTEPTTAGESSPVDRAARSDGRVDSKAQKRRRILDAAVKVFAQKGFYNTKVTEIAKEAGVADGTIYLYFKNKDDVLLSVYRDSLRSLIDAQLEAIHAAPTSADRIRSIVRIQLETMGARGKDLAEVMTVNLRQSRTLLEDAVPLFKEYLGVLATVLHEGQERGEVRRDINPRIAARALWAGMDGIAFTWALDNPDPKALKKATDQFTEIFLSGVLHPEDRTADQTP